MIDPGAIPVGHETGGEFVRRTTKWRHLWLKFLCVGCDIPLMHTNVRVACLLTPRDLPLNADMTYPK
jgi:hypothetical protein